jgi:hypothetical protein
MQNYCIFNYKSLFAGLCFDKLFAVSLHFANFRGTFENCRATIVDCQVAAQGQLQVVPAENAKEKAGQHPQVDQGEGTQDLCDQADTNVAHSAGAGVHQSQVGRQSGCQVGAKVSMVVESAPSVRLDQGRAEFWVSFACFSSR